MARPLNNKVALRQQATTTYLSNAYSLQCNPCNRNPCKCPPAVVGVSWRQGRAKKQCQCLRGSARGSRGERASARVHEGATGRERAREGACSCPRGSRHGNRPLEQTGSGLDCLSHVLGHQPRCATRAAGGVPLWRNRQAKCRLMRVCKRLKQQQRAAARLDARVAAHIQKHNAKYSSRNRDLCTLAGPSVFGRLGRAAQFTPAACLRLAFATQDTCASLSREKTCSRAYVRRIRLAVAECVLRRQAAAISHVLACMQAKAATTMVAKVKWDETPQELTVTYSRQSIAASHQLCVIKRSYTIGSGAARFAFECPCIVPIKVLEDNKAGTISSAISQSVPPRPCRQCRVHSADT